MPVKLPEYLPLSLFDGKKEGETVFFYYKGQPLEFTLNQMNHHDPRGQAKFEDFVEVLKANFDLNGDYLFKQSMPEGVQVISNKSLSKEAKVWDAKQSAFIPATQEDITFFRDFVEKSIPAEQCFSQEGKNILHYRWPGLKSNEDIRVFIDRNHLIAVGIPTHYHEFRKGCLELAEDKGGTVIYSSPIEQYSIGIKLADPTLDLTKTTWEIENHELVVFRFSE